VKWALYALGTFVALIALVFVIGSSLAKQHEATRAARFHQPPETIWGVITDYSKFTTTMEDYLKALGQKFNEKTAIEE
jgi:hypothetical protein